MTTPLAIRDTPGGCVLSVRVHPGGKANAIAGMHDGALKISLTTPPTDGRANDALIAFIAGHLRVPRSRIALLTGAASRNKTLSIAGKGAAEVHAALDPSVNC